MPSKLVVKLRWMTLLLNQIATPKVTKHIIDLTRNDDASSSSSHDGRPPEIDLPQHEDRSSGGASGPTHQISSSSLNELNSRSSAFTRRRDGYDHRRRSPLNSALWISIELFVTVGQIIASIVVVSLSRDENPQAPLFAWVVGYASGCVARLPILYWRFRNCYQSSQQDSVQSHQGSSQDSLSDSSYAVISVTQASDEENFSSTESTTINGQAARQLGARLNGLMNHFKMALDCFFAVWFVVGNVWIFGGHSTPNDAPKLYKDW
ncbi:hypothetical protein P3X46_010942 [Hevea brasiliensis]|uniref:Uncharacterized protein n=1 Tax=Hevea brasiliensis TaxID=3981 RepID=A0ABQ9MFM2_HEVBR|nr:hypothetical protein P3X46_010942 [Hevea brasiliensis]